MIKFIVLVLSIVLFVLSVIYFLYRYQMKNREVVSILKRPLPNQPVVSKPLKTPLLANARGGNFERTYLDHKSKMIKNKQKRVKFNEKVKTLNYQIQKQNEEIAKRNSMF